MSNILCAAVSGLSGCTDILVIVWQTTVFFCSGWNIALFPIQYILLHFFLQLCLQHSLSFQEKLLRDIIVKYLGLRLRCVILRPVTNKFELLDKFR